MQLRGTTLVVLLGASSFPRYPTLDAAPAFLHSKEDFKEYLLSSTGMALPKENILDLFDAKSQPADIEQSIHDFLSPRMGSQSPPSDVIFYYCGHGAYLKEGEYFLALACASKAQKEATAFKISYLVNVISSVTQDARNLVILDACYSGGALVEFGHMDAEEDASAAVKAQFASADDPMLALAPGVILFCAAGAKKWAKTPLEGRNTMFSGALLEVLKEGDAKSGPSISVKRIGELMRAKIRAAFGQQGVTPQIHVPVQGESNLLDVLYFPNPAFDVSAFDHRISKLENASLDLQLKLQKESSARSDLDGRLASLEALGLSAARPPKETKVTSPSTAASRHHLELWTIRLKVLLATTFFLGIVNYLTWVPLKTLVSVTEMTPGVLNFLKVTIAFSLCVHAILILIGAIGQVRGGDRLRPSPIPSPLDFLRHFVPPWVASWAILWNSIIVAAILGYLLLMGDFSAIAIQRIVPN